MATQIRKYAVQRIDNGQVIDYVDTLEQASFWIQKEEGFEIVATNTSSVVVTYTELGGPNGYGHQEEPFTTYGGIVRCIINLYKWAIKEASFWGPSPRDIKDYLKKCSVIVNGQDRTQWFLAQVDKISYSYNRPNKKSSIWNYQKQRK